MSSVNVRRLVATMFGLGLAVAMTPAVAGAWCRLPGDYAAFWRSQAPDLRIPVYLGTGYRSSILYTGMPLEQVRAVVERMIAVHNEAVSVPTLYFAGTTEADLEEDGGMRARPVGIVVDSYICSGFGSTVPCTLDQLGCTSPGGNTPDQLGKARVTIQPQLCGKEGVFWGIEPGDGKDLMRVVLHEFGHALGLDHTNEAACTDDPEGPGTGVMSRIFGFSDVYERTWRRDDIAGLRAIYGGDISHSVYTWADDGFPQAPEETQREAVCEPMRTPPSLSSAASLVMAYTDAEDRVAVVVREEGRFVAPAGGAVVDPSEHGISFAPVGVANRDGDEAVVLVVWVADDARDARSSRLRWALRPLPGGAWKYGYLLTPTGETQTSARVAVGFDAETRRFVITSLTDDGRPYVVTMDTSGEQRATTVLESAQVPAVVAFEIGRASCGEGSVCKIGYRSSRYRPLWSEEILWAGWLEVEIGADDVVTLVGEQTVGAFDSQGMIDLAGRAGELRGGVGEQR